MNGKRKKKINKKKHLTMMKKYCIIVFEGRVDLHFDATCQRLKKRTERRVCDVCVKESVKCLAPHQFRPSQKPF